MWKICLEKFRSQSILGKLVQLKSMKFSVHLGIYLLFSVTALSLSSGQTQTGKYLTPSSVVSRLTHGSAGSFDIVLPLQGKPGIECRAGNGGNYSVVFTFPLMVTFASASLVNAGPGYSGSVVSTSDGSTPNTQVTVNLSSVSDGQTVTIKLASVRHVSNTGGPSQNDVSVEMGVRVGDVDGSATRDSLDISSITSKIGQNANINNFRNDVNNDGLIRNADKSIPSSTLGQTLNYSTFTFTLDGSYQTSAGVYDLSGRLIRTLWSNSYYSAGTFTSTWDGNDDYGIPQASGNYEIRLLQHNVQYIFDGAIGNTSSTQVGPGVHNNSCFMRSLALSGTNAYYAIGESENEINVSKFLTTAPQSKTDVTSSSINAGFDIVATDGNIVYLSEGGADYDYYDNGHYTSFITAHSASDNTEYMFQYGTNVALDGSHQYNGVIDVNTWIPPSSPSPTPTPSSQANPNHPTGLAVQRGATGILAVAHGGPGGPDEIRLFDKTTGAQLTQKISQIPNPKDLTIDSAGNLWAISGTTVRKYTNLSSTPVWARTISGLSQPIAVSASSSNPDLILVADGGSAQVVKAYNRNGQQVWTYGALGGWDSNGPDVTDSPPKFDFRVGFRRDIQRTALAVADDGSFWVGDGATSRLLHVNSSHTAIIAADTLMFLARHNWVAADITNPRRVIGDGWLEFDVDYTKPIKTAWTLKKNWAAGMKTDYLNGANSPGGLLSVTTLSNGRVYGTVDDATDSNKKVVVELPESTPNTPVRVCQANGLDLKLGVQNQAVAYGNFQQPEWLSPDGAVRYPKWAPDSNNIPTIQFWERTLSGFDAGGNPLWNTDIQMASAPYSNLDPGSLNDAENIAYPLIASDNVDKIVIFEPQISKNQLTGDPVLATGFHIGAIARNDTKWLWRSSPGVSADLPFDGQGSFDLGDSTSIGGIVVKGFGRHLIYSYPGEYWNASEASQWMHYYDDGLLVGQFGTSADYGIGFVGARPGFSGNSFYHTIVGADANGNASTNGDLYLYANDQTDHSGIIRWHIIGANGIRDQRGSGALGGSITLTGAAATFPTGLTAIPDNGVVNLSWNAVSGATNYTVMQSTASGGPYVQALTSSTNSGQITGLSNGTQYFFVVAANTNPGVNSNQVQAFPFNTVGVAGRMDGGLPGAHLDALHVDSMGPSTGKPALVGLNNLFGNLSRTSVGTKGYIVFDWQGGGTSTSSTPVPFTTATNYLSPITKVKVNITTGSAWFNQNNGASGTFLIDGALGNADEDQDNACLNLHSATNGSVDVTVSDTSPHYVTVFSPSISANSRTCTVTLTPKGQSTPAAVYQINESIGINHVFQFSFKGNVTLQFSNVTGPFNSEGGGLQALFFD